MPKTATGLTTTIQNEEIRKYLGNYSQNYYIGTNNRNCMKSHCEQVTYKNSAITFQWLTWAVRNYDYFHQVFRTSSL